MKHHPPSRRRFSARRLRFGGEPLLPRTQLPPLSERIDLERVTAENYRRLARQADNPEQRARLLARAEKHDQGAARLAIMLRGRQHSPGSLFADPLPPPSTPP